MGSEVLLQSACELSYQIARDGVETSPPTDPPAAMRSFLYVSELPNRALTVAQQAIEDDPAFRRRVAEQADEEVVGRAGYLWLHRPIGWAAEFEELSSLSDAGELDPPVSDFGSQSIDFDPSPPPPGPGDSADYDGPPPDPIDGDLADADLSGSPFAAGDLAGDLNEGDLVDGDGVLAAGLAESDLAAGDLADEGFSVSGLGEQEELDDGLADGVSPLGGEADLADDDGFVLGDDAGVGEPTVNRSMSRSLFGRPNVDLDADFGDSADAAAAADIEIPDTAEELVSNDAVDSESIGDEVSVGADAPAGAASALGFGSIDAFGNGEGGGLDLPRGEATGRSEANAIEDELSSLRGLVDRLSSERKAVSTSVRKVEAEVETSRSQPSMFDSDIYTLQSELEAARAELDQSRAERDTAVHQRSESLTRQLELEKELERAREQRAELEREHEDVDTSIVGLRESLARAEASLTNVASERDDLRSQLGELTVSNEALNTQLASVTEEQAATAKALQADHSALQAEADALRADKDGLDAKLSTVESELNDAKAQLSQTGTQAAEAKSLVDALTEEKIDLASRLADTEAMLETTRVQLSAVKSDSEAVTADLSNIKAHRDGLAVQVEELHGSLSEALSDLAKVRSTSDADRASLKEVRSERDLLRVRVGSLEQIETGLEAKLDNLSTERDSFLAKADLAESEVAQLQRDQRTLTTERDQLVEELSAAEEAKRSLVATAEEKDTEIESLRSQNGELEAARDGLNQQVEQLNGENASIQSQLVEADRLRIEAAENQGHALSELAQRLSLVENERTRLEADLREAEGRLSESLVTLEAARDEVERVRSERDNAERERANAERLSAEQASVAPAAFSPLVGGNTGVPVDASPSLEAAPDVTSEVAAPLADVSPADPTSSIDLSPAADVSPPAEPIDAPPAPLATDPAAGVPMVEVESGRAVTGDLPPPPAPSEEPVAAAAAAPAPPVAPEVEAKPEEDEGRSTKRSGWGIGALRRGDNDAPDAEDVPPPPPPVSPEVATADPLAVDNEEPELVASALAETLQEGKAEEAVSDDEIDSISTELSQALGDTSIGQNDDDEDLDEISNLISQTVTDFDPKSLERPNFDGEAASESEADAGRKSGGLSRRFLSGRLGEKNTSGPLPPSVFGESGSDPSTDTSIEGVDQSTEGDDDTALFPADGAVGDMKGGRRQIEIPADIQGDEVEMARHVVSSPDVVLLVDGDSVAKMGWPSLPVAQQRDALVSYLADLSASTGAAPDVVFDGRIGEEESLPASRAVRIRLSTPPTEPAAALDELVDAYPEQWPIAIVTDDGNLGRSAHERGAVVLNNGQLLDLFIA